jgi:radical SAM protein with 4Fe4S-binding SPASM domain
MSSVKNIAKKIVYRIPILKDHARSIKWFFEGRFKTIKERNELLEELADYKESTIEQMEKIAFARPLDIALETYTRCNSRCAFCAYRKLKRKKELMSMGLFEKICTEYMEMGGGTIGFAPLMSDPLLDPLLLDRMRLARKWHPAIRMHMFTNAIQFNRFTDKDILFVLDSIEGLNISLSVLSREDYKKMFQVDKYDAVLNTLQRIHRLKNEIEFPPDIALHIRTSQKEATLQSENYKKFVDMGFGCEDVADHFSDWGGVIKPEDLPEGATLSTHVNKQATFACLIPMISLTISANGDVVACGCFDGKMEHLVGNAGSETLQEIWQGDALKAFRDAFEKKQFPEICVTCSQYMPYRGFFALPSFIGFNPGIHSFWATLYSQRPYSPNIINKKNFRYF